MRSGAADVKIKRSHSGMQTKWRERKKGEKIQKQRGNKKTSQCPAVPTPRSTLLAVLQSTSNTRLAFSLRHMDISEPFVVISLWRAYLTKAQRTATCRDEQASASDWLLNTL
ncbi:hypothetical protein E1301_Tti008520 [Triplophysa tibetana]|uniref:Uncharacterized protein n=1 Tax=Triplophysa tibetana TaxID=1572043 RepID=A0A5A9P3D0_9TELE|nr:hypothetical protein E1301_Tti008520 [Triplophysa tibetana]